MGKILEPNIVVEDIIIDANEDDEYNVNRKINEWGYSIPLVKINEFVLDIGAVTKLDVNVTMYNIPTFNMVVDDFNSMIQSALKNKEDKCIIFIGTKDFYIKFNGLITNIDTTNSGRLLLSGIFYVKELFDNKQQAFNDKSVIDILTTLCENTKLGLYIYDNQALNVTVENYLLPNINQLSGINNIIDGYTDNLWSIDTFGYLHLGTVQSILEKPIDKYTLNPMTQQQLPGEKDMLFVYGRQSLTSEEAIDEVENDNNRYKYAIVPEYLKVESNFSMTKIDSANTYKLYDGKANEKILEENINIGIETVYADNTFSGFFNSKFPLRNERINKVMYGNAITMELRSLMFEIVPFSVVELEIYVEGSAYSNKHPVKENAYTTDGPTDEIDNDAQPDSKKALYHLDEIHSGKHFVAGYSYNYRKNKGNENQNFIKQTVYLI